MALGIILWISWLRAAHLEFPLERDEGEFGYIAQEILRGVPVYDSAYTQKLPGPYLMYALFLAVFGQSVAAIHIGLLLTNAAIMGLMFLVLRKTHGGVAGCIGVLVFGIMSMSPTVLGFAAHATFFVTLFAVAGLYVLLHARDRGRAMLFLASGVCFGFAFLMKQSGIFFAPLALSLLAIDHLALKPRRPARFALQALALGAGAVAPFLLTAAYYVVIGTFSRFWFWTFQLAGDFATQEGPDAALTNLLDGTRIVISGFEVLWGLALVGLVTTLRSRSLGTHRYVYAAFAGASILSLVPGFFFTRHYYVTLLAAIAFLVGALGGTGRSGQLSGGSLAKAAGIWILAGAGLLGGMARHKDYYFSRRSDLAVSRSIYWGNPFAESMPIGEYLKRHTAPEDRIAMLGSETQILFYAQRRSASRFVNAYFLTADHPRNRDMQREMIRDVELTRPKYIVFARLPMSWGLREDSPRDILDWFEYYTSKYYRLEGVLDLAGGQGVLKWEADARSQPRTPKGIEILRRRDPG